MEKPKIYFFVYGPDRLDDLPTELGTNITQVWPFYTIFDEDSIVKHLLTATTFTKVREAILPKDHPSILKPSDLFPDSYPDKLSMGSYRSKVVILGEELDLSNPSTYSKFSLDYRETELLEWAGRKSYIALAEYLITNFGHRIFNRDFSIYRMGDITLFPYNLMVSICEKSPKVPDLYDLRKLASEAIKNDNLPALQYFVGKDARVSTFLAFDAVLHQRYCMLQYVVGRGADIKTETAAVIKARELGLDQYEKYLVKRGAKAESLYARLDRKAENLPRKYPKASAVLLIGVIGMCFAFGYVACRQIHMMFK